MLRIFNNLRVTANAFNSTTIRYYRRGRYNNTYGDPGIKNTVKLFQEGGLKEELNEDLLEVLDDIESDISNMPQLSEAHPKLLKKKRLNIKNKIIEQKYFHETYPNLLTWSEKEQIRYLHKSDPEQWNFERLSESFPTTKYVIEKLVKFPWKPANINRINRHDATAMRNWKELKEGTLENVTPEMREHFLKFSDRVIPPRRQADQEQTVRLSLEENVTGEFGSIIENYQKAVESEYTEKFVKEKPKEITEKINKSKIDKNRSPLTYSEYISKEGIVVDESQIQNKKVNQKEDNYMKVYSNTFVISNDDKKDKLENIKKEPDNEVISIPQRIKIPRNVWKKGGTYKLNDCYYDYDGVFLFRVPGMTS